MSLRLPGQVSRLQELRHAKCGHYVRLSTTPNKCAPNTSLIKDDQQRRTVSVNLTFIGPPGSGKGTYSSLLLQSKSISKSSETPPVVLSAGDILREHVGRGTDIGRRVAKYQSQGELVADDTLVANAIRQSLEDRDDTFRKSKIDEDRGRVVDENRLYLGFILDGFPRTVAQAEIMSDWPEHLRITHAVSVEVPEVVCTLKIMGRRKCRVCGESFNINAVDHDGFFMPATTCACESPVDQRNFHVREDDTREIAMTRYEQFSNETAPLIQYYENLNRLIRFVPYNGVDDMPKLESLIKLKVYE